MKKSFLRLSLTVAALLVLSGCAILQDQNLNSDPLTDEGIAFIAGGRLNSDPMTARAILSVTVDNGLATLHGTVPDEAVRQRAIQILESSDGISDVLDRTRTR